jgi:peptidyl-prolyl cis-trans isomerase C
MKFVALILILGFLIGANISAASQPSPTAGEVLARVGDEEITREMIDNIIATIPEDKRVPFLMPDGRKKLLDEVVSFMLFSKAAKAAGIDKEPAVKARLEYIQTEYLAREYSRRRLAQVPPVSESDLQAYYKEHIGEFKPREEIKARHILVKTEAEANNILTKIKAGEDFVELAKKYSIDPAAAKGGRLESYDGREWLPKGTFEASFEHAVFKIPKGQVGGPIKTQFGWHVVKVEDRRQPETPSFVQVRAMIKQRLEDKKKAEIHKQITEELKRSIPVVIK